jgi:hypothetical protein
MKDIVQRIAKIVIDTMSSMRVKAEEKLKVESLKFKRIKLVFLHFD